MELEAAKQRLFDVYRSQKGLLARVEKRWCEKPTTEDKEEMIKRRGVLEGIQKALDAIENRMNNSPLPGFERKK